MEKDIEVKEPEHDQIEDMENEQDLEKKKKREAVFEMALFFILGVLIGITIKTEAAKKITIGFNDYQIPRISQSYDTKQLKQNLIQEAQSQQQEAQQALPQEQQTEPQQDASQSTPANQPQY